MPEERLEDWRQLEHLVPVGFAFLLPYLSFEVILALCGLAIAHALYFSPRIIRLTMRSEEGGFSAGKLAYALAVLALILVFHDRLYIAASVWGMLAVGDAFSNVFGRRFGRRVLPFNHEKTWVGFFAFWVTGTLAGWILLVWNLDNSEQFSSGILYGFCGITGLLCALAESAPTVINDNVLVAWVGGVSFAVLFSWAGSALTLADDLITVTVANAIVAVIAGTLRWISLGGIVLAFLFGVLVWLGLGLTAYLSLFTFLVIGNLATRVGLRRKVEMRVAEGNRGKRGISNVLCNGFVPVLAAFAGFWIDEAWLGVAFLSAVATAAFDTVSTELGQWLGKTPIDLIRFRKVPVGTQGAVSLEGTLFGFVAAVLVAVPAVLMGAFPALVMLPVVVAAFVGGIGESLVASILEKKPPHSDEVLNVLNTLLGASIGGLIWWSI